MCCVMGYTGHDLSAAKFKEYLLRTVMRGPDDQRVVEGPFGLMGFGRLAIMGLTPEGMQPFYRGADCVVCNGELYGFRFEKEILTDKDKFNEYIMTNLRTMWGIQEEKMRLQFPDFSKTVRPKLAPFLENGSVVCQNGRIRLTEKGWLVSDDVFSDLFVV